MITFPLLAPSVELIGRINESPLLARYGNSIYGADRRVYRLDRTGGSLNILNETTVATSGVANAWSPFGNNVIPVGATLKVYDSIDGLWSSNPLTLTTGDINAFKSTGWKKIVFGQSAARQLWRPSSDPQVGIQSCKYIRFELDDGADRDSFIVCDGNKDIIEVRFNVTTAGNATTAARVSEIVLIRRPDDVRWFNTTSVANDDINTSYTPGQATYLPNTTLETWIAFAERGYALEEYLFLRDGTGLTWAVEYSNGPSSTATLSSYVSGSNFFQNGPVSLQTPADHFTSTFDPPANWVKQSRSFVLENGSTETLNAYWLRYRMTAAASEDPQPTPAARMRLRQYGSANTEGMQYSVARTLRGVGLFFRGPINGTGAVTLEVANLTTGQSRTVLIPSTVIQGTYQNFDIDDIQFSANDKRGVIYKTGNRQFQNVDYEEEF